MKIQILSDVHNEFIKSRVLYNTDNDWGAIIPETDADVIVLAGDIGIRNEGVIWASQESKRLNKPIIYIPGNHEYYNGDLQLVRSTLFQTAEESQKNTEDECCVYVLDEHEIVIQGVRFLGCTLWSDYLADPNTFQNDAMNIVGECLNDHHIIRYQGKLFTTEDALALHLQARNWLEQKLSEDFEGNTVVVTHHGPSLICQHQSFEVGPISGAFYSDLDKLVGKADLWIYGHTHSCLDTVINGTRLIANQYGYSGRETCKEFNSRFIVELE